MHLGSVGDACDMARDLRVNLPGVGLLVNYCNRCIGTLK